MKEARYKEPTSAWIHSCEISRAGKFIVTENRGEGAKGEEEGKRGVTA